MIFALLQALEPESLQYDLSGSKTQGVGWEVIETKRKKVKSSDQTLILEEWQELGKRVLETLSKEKEKSSRNQQTAGKLKITEKQDNAEKRKKQPWMPTLTECESRRASSPSNNVLEAQAPGQTYSYCEQQIQCEILLPLHARLGWEKNSSAVLAIFRSNIIRSQFEQGFIVSTLSYSRESEVTEQLCLKVLGVILLQWLSGRCLRR